MDEAGRSVRQWRSGVYDIFQWPPNLFGEDPADLGFPDYFGTIVGTWKVLGAVALVVPRFAIVKEWAYAGFTFTMTGAIATNVAVGAEPIPSLAAAAFLPLGAVSHLVRAPSRRPVWGFVDERAQR